MEHLYKSFELKADGTDSGEIKGYFSTYDKIPDSYGDIVMPGAFTETIKNRIESGHPFPLCWNHDLDQIIGSVDPADIIDDEHGPLMTAKFFNSALAQEKRELVKSGVIYQFSFAYDIIEARKASAEEKKAGIEQALIKVDLFEVSIVPIPANPRAEVTEIKSVVLDTDIVNIADTTATIKSGRRNSASDADKLEQAITLLRDVLGQIDDTEEEPEQGKDDPEVNTAVEEQKESNPQKAILLEYLKTMKQEVEDDESEN